MHARPKNDFDVKKCESSLESAKPELEYSVKTQGLAGFFKSTSRYFGNAFWPTATGLTGRIRGQTNARKPVLKKLMYAVARQNL